MKKKKVIIALGSNSPQAEQLIEEAKKALMLHIDDVYTTKKLWNKAVGDVFNEDDMFCNCLLIGYCSLDYESLDNQLKAIESALGNSLEERQRGNILIDIDILLLGRRKYHQKDWERDYVKALKMK